MQTWVRWPVVLFAWVVLAGCEQSAGNGPSPRLLVADLPDSYVGLRMQPTVIAEGDIASWEWDFGSGALPQHSTEANPLVELQASGRYAGRVTISNGQGRSDTLDFSYEVYPAEPPAIESISPADVAGTELTDAVFAARATGEVREWRWDFGASAIPQTSADASPSVRLQAPGDYEATLRICGERGCSEPKTFRVQVRASQVVWSHAPVLEGIEKSRLLLTADARLLLLCTRRDSDGFPEPLLLQAAMTDHAEALHWRTDVLPSPTGSFLRLDGVAHNSDVLLAMTYWDAAAAGQRTRLGRLSPEAPASLTTTELAGYVLQSGIWRPTPALKLVRETVFANVVDATGETRVLGLEAARWPSTEGQFEMDLDGEAEIQAWDFLEQQGTTLIAFITDSGDQTVGPGSLIAGRLKGPLQDGLAAWHLVAVDRSARSSPTVALVPTRTGVHLIYGAFHGLQTTFNESDQIPYKEPSDFGLREAWTTSLDFQDLSDWETGRSAVLPGAQAVTVVATPRGPLVLGSDIVSHYRPVGWPVLMLGKGYSEVAGDLPWQVATRDFLEASIEDVSGVPTANGGWIAFTHYREVFCSSGHGDQSCSLYDPVLMIGKLTLE